jgi:hypothetical protein
MTKWRDDEGPSHGKRLRVRGPALSVPDLHRLRIARQTLKYSDEGARIMGGMTKEEARQVIYELTGRRENPSYVPDEGPIEHLKNAAAIISANLQLGEKDALVADDARAVLARIKAALRQLEDKRVDMRLPNGRRSGRIRRGNPALMVLGANPRVADATLATWAKIEYRRPDDPDGEDVIRVHEFKDGFEIGWLDDGSVQLSHPRHPLWTDDEIGRA